MLAPERIRVRSLLWPTVMSLSAFAILLGLGTWQLERRAWKAELIAVRTERLAAAPLAAVDLARPPAELAFRRVRLTGRFLHDRETVIQARTRRETGEAGAHVITPLALDAGPTVLVDRGWVSLARMGRATAHAQPEGPVEVSGVVTPGGRASSWTPDNDAARNSWFYVDPAAIAAARGLGPVPAKVPDLVVEADATPHPGGMPVGGQTATELPNRHLEYALTWYSLALALVVVYVLYVRRHAKPG